MGDSSADRQRRYRQRQAAHKVGDHSLCVDPQQCGLEPGEPSPVTAPVTVPRLGHRGRRLWRELTDGQDLRPADRLLIEEACRTADRLDRLDAILRGDEDAWLSLAAVTEDGNVVKVVVTGALVEVRQQQLALKAMLGELRQSRAAASKPPAGRPEPGQAKEAAGVPAGVTSLADRIAAKRGAQASG